MAYPNVNQDSPDFAGSRDEWEIDAARIMIDRYRAGDQSMLDNMSGATGSIGQPDRADWGGASGRISRQTEVFFLAYVRANAASENWGLLNIAAPPDRNATIGPDPNSPSALQTGSQNFAREQNALDRAATAASEERAAASRAAGDAAQAQATLGAASIHAGATIAGAQIDAAARIAAANIAAASDAARIAAEERMHGITNATNILGINTAASTAAARLAGDMAMSAADRENARYLQDNQQKFLAGENALNRDLDWKTAQLKDATDRYIAEGSWGVQKYVAELQEKGSLERLKMELGMREKELAQTAIGEANRHHETMVGLALDVAKYDAELGAQPRNWLKYAGWLQSRNIVVNGMTMAMAAQEVPDQAINPADVAGSGIAGAQFAMAQMQAQTTSSTASTAGQPPQDGSTAGQPPPTGPQQGSLATGAQLDPGGTRSAGIDLNSTNYSEMTNKLLGLNPLNPNPATDASQSNLQSIADGLNTAGRRIASFGSYSGPNTNIQGVTVQNQGQMEDPRQWANLLPSEQQMKAGAVESTGRFLDDYMQEMNKARPKGIAPRGATAAYG